MWVAAPLRCLLPEGTSARHASCAFLTCSLSQAPWLPHRQESLGGHRNSRPGLQTVATGGPLAHRLSWWQSCSGSYAAERVFLKIMLTAVRQLSVMAALEHILQPMAVWSPCCRSKYSSSRRPRSTAPARLILIAMIPYSCPHPLQNVHPQHNTVLLPCEFSQTTRYTIA